MGIFFKAQRDTLSILNYPKLSRERETRSCVMWRHVRPMEQKNHEYWPFLMKMILDSPIVPLGTSNFDMLYYVKTFLSLERCFNVGICEFLHEVCHFVMYLSRTLWHNEDLSNQPSQIICGSCFGFQQWCVGLVETSHDNVYEMDHWFKH
jgi:hypothetical protein